MARKPTENKAVGAVTDALRLDNAAARAAIDPTAESADESSSDSAELPPEAAQENPQEPRSREIEETSEEAVLSPELLASLEGPGQMPPAPRSKEERRLEALRAREEQKLIPPSLKRLGALAAKLPGAEHVKIHKREDSGQVAYVGTYTQRDLKSTQDIEAFIYTYLKPKWGPGEYLITATDAHGRALEAGAVVIAKPEEEAPMSAGTTPLDIVKTLLDRERAPVGGGPRGPAAPTIDPIDQMKRLHDLQSSLEERATANTGGMGQLVATIIQTSAQQNQMMIQMMKDSAERGEDRMMQMMAAMRGPEKKDETTPVVMSLLVTLISKMFESKSESSAPMPMPMLPPPPDPLAQMEKMASIFSMMQPKSDDKLTQYLLQNQVGFKEALEITKNSSPMAAPGGLKESMEQVQMLLGLAMQLKQQQEPGASSGFWDALQTLFSNRGLGEGLSGFLKAKAVPALPPGGNAVDMETALHAQADRIKQQRILEARARVEQEARLLQEGRQQPPALPPAQTAAAAAPTVIPPAAEPAAAPEPGAVPPAPTPSAPPPRKQLTMPEGIDAPINAIVLASSDEDRVGAVVKLLEFFGEQEDWSGLISAIFEAIAKGEKEKAMSHITSMFEGLIAIQLIEVPIAQKARDAFDAAFEDVSEYLRTKLEAAEADEDDAEEDEDADAEEDEASSAES